jgi:uncharacterized protein (DUF1800 family)
MNCSAGSPPATGSDAAAEAGKDPAMLIWLDQAQSRKEHPNENFAREVMELFSLGEGHYTEHDITEAARALTGWSLDRLNRNMFTARSSMTTATKRFRAAREILTATI